MLGAFEATKSSVFPIWFRWCWLSNVSKVSSSVVHEENRNINESGLCVFVWMIRICVFLSFNGDSQETEWEVDFVFSR